MLLSPESNGVTYFACRFPAENKNKIWNKQTLSSCWRMLASKSDRFQLYPKKQKWKAGGLGGGVEVGDPTASVVGVAVLVGDMW